MEKDTLAEFPKDGETNLVETEEETKPTESQPEKEEKEDNVPFHKHPRWIAKQQEIDALNERLEQLENKKEEPSREVKTELPEWWKNYYGNDEKSQGAYKEYVKQTEEFRSNVEEGILTKLEEREHQKAVLEQEADEYIENELKELQSDGQKFDRNELLKFMLDFEEVYKLPIVNEKGQYDFRKGLQLMNEMIEKEETHSTENKKKVAALTLRSTSAKSTEKDETIPSHQLRRGGWIPPRT